MIHIIYTIKISEGVLLAAGFVNEAFARHAVEATYSTTNLTPFKTIAKEITG